MPDRHAAEAIALMMADLVHISRRLTAVLKADQKCPIISLSQVRCNIYNTCCIVGQKTPKNTHADLLCLVYTAQVYTGYSLTLWQEIFTPIFDSSYFDSLSIVAFLVKCEPF